MATGNPYVPVTITGYNVTPPTDGGEQTANNTVEWAKHKAKLGDPVKTGVEATQTAITAALDRRLLNSIDGKTGNYTVLTTDRGKILNFTGATPSTFTLLASATAKLGFELVIRNFGTAVLTVDGNAAETIDGLATIGLFPGQTIWMMCDGTNWVVASNSLRPGVVAKTNADSPYTVLVDDNGRVLDVDASGGAVTINLPAAATAKNGFAVTVKKTDSSTNAVTIDGDGTETIDGTTTKVILSQYSALRVVCDGTEWHLTQGSVGSGLVAITGLTASASATIEFTDIDSTYDHYILDCINVRPATDVVELWLRLSDDNGSTFKAGASDYSFGVAGGAFTTTTQLRLSNISTSALGNAADEFYNASVNIWAPAGSGKTHLTATYGYTRSTDQAQVDHFMGKYNTAVATDAIQILMSSGNIAEGTFNLYGVVKP